jgi:hypothetical protein
MKIKNLVLWPMIFCFTQSVATFALPLMAENAAQKVSSVLTLYPDHIDPNLVYFMPNSSMFATEASTGLPEFSFTYYGLDKGVLSPDAGAYMVFDLRLHSDADQKAALDAVIASGKHIAVLPVQSSTIGLTSTATGGLPLGPYFKEFNFAKMAGRAEDEVAVNAILTGLGAKVFKASIESSALLKVDYCYMVEGLGPNFDARIDLDWVRIYDDLKTHFDVGFWFVRASIDAELERLRQSDAIHIQINGGDAALDEYVKQTADKIVERLFKNDLSMTPTNPAGNQGSSFENLTLAYTHREELKHESWSLTKRDLVKREFCVPLLLNDIHNNSSKLVHNADAP